MSRGKEHRKGMTVERGIRMIRNAKTGAVRYRVQMMIGGQRAQKMCKTEAEAVQLREEWIRGGVPVVVPQDGPAAPEATDEPAQTVEDAVRWYQQDLARRECGALGVYQLERWMATADSILGALLATPLSALDGDAILDYLHDRETESRTKTGTRYKRTSILREYRNLHAAIRKFRPDLDWPNMRGKRGWSEGQQIPREPMTAEQKTRLLVALEEPYRTVAQLGMWLNPRRASFAKMERAHCHLDDPNGAWLLLPETKAHKQEIVPLEPPAIALFRAQLARHPGNKWVFPSPWKNGQTPISGGQFFVRVKRALRTIGRPDLNFHSLRHQFASDLLQQGYSLEKIAKAGRWDRVVKIYAHQADADTRAMQRALAHPASPRRRKLGGIV